MKKILIIHHTDLDGAASAAIVGLAHKSDLVVFMKHNYNIIINPKKLEGYDIIYAVDISFSDNPWVYELPQLIWIDHHKTALDFEASNDKIKSIPGYRKIGVGACELCWEYIYPNYPCPPLIQYLSAYDVWDKGRFLWQTVEKVEYGAKLAYGNNPKLIMNDLINPNFTLSKLEYDGGIILSYLEKSYKSYINNYGMIIPNFHGNRVIAMNTQEFSSKTFESRYDEENFDIMMVFCFCQSGIVRCSLYSTKDNIDCSSIALYYGGGGHKGAAGFSIPWMDMIEIMKTSIPLPKIS